MKGKSIIATAALLTTLVGGALAGCSRDRPRSPLPPRLRNAERVEPAEPESPQEKHRIKNKALREALWVMPAKDVGKLLDHGSLLSQREYHCKALAGCHDFQKDYVGQLTGKGQVSKFEGIFDLERTHLQVLETLERNTQPDELTELAKIYSLLVSDSSDLETEIKARAGSKLEKQNSKLTMRLNASLGLSEPGAPSLDALSGAIIARYQKEDEKVRSSNGDYTGVDSRDETILEPLAESIGSIYQTRVVLEETEQKKWAETAVLAYNTTELEKMGIQFSGEEKVELYTKAAEFHLALGKLSFDCDGECPTPRYDHMKEALAFYEALGPKGQEGFTKVFQILDDNNMLDGN